MRDLSKFLKNIEVKDNEEFEYDIVKLFSENVRRIRLEKKLTLEELSFRCSLHRNYLCDVERGKRNVSLKAIKKIADGLEVAVSEMFRK